MERTVVAQYRRKLDPETLHQHTRVYPEACLKDQVSGFQEKGANKKDSVSLPTN